MVDDQGNALSLAPGMMLEEYRIEGILGKGGFAITYSALDLNLNKWVAIKELMPDGIATRVQGTTVVAQTEALRSDFEWAIDSFCKESQTLAGFEHPNIVRVSRFFRKNGTAYMVMPLIEGRDLKQIIKERGQFSYQGLLAILTPLLDGLREVHQANVLHRDIKPENIYLTNRGVPILIDFGAARQQISGRSLDVTSIITPGYAAIEQYSTDARYQGPWSDIYGVAACIYHMITGQKPVSASERSDAARNHQPDPLPRLSELRPLGFPPQFLDGVDQALQLGEKLRPQTVETWMSLLNRPGAPQATPAPPPGDPRVVYPEPPKRPVVGPRPRKKNLTAFYLILALLVIALLGLGGFVLYSLQDDHAAWTSEPSTGGDSESKTPPRLVGMKAGERKLVQADGVEIALSWCPAGRFKMGSPADEAGRYDDEKQHTVNLTRGFWLGKTEVTQGQWQAVMGRSQNDQVDLLLNDSGKYKFDDQTLTMAKHFERWYGENYVKILKNFAGGKDYPIWAVNWQEAVDFCERLTAQEQNAGRLPSGWSYRLPTEAEWEYACRAGTTAATPAGDLTIKGKNLAPELDAISWYGGNSSHDYPAGKGLNTANWSEKQYPGGRAGPREVGGKKGNAWGLQDMIGNVSEWTGDWFQTDLSDLVTDPQGPRDGRSRVHRGGMWGSYARACRSAFRNIRPPSIRHDVTGFRVCLARSD